MAKGVRQDREQRRNESVELLTKARDIIQDLAEEMRNAFEALPEGLQQSEQGQMKEAAADVLDEQVGDIESTMGELEGLDF